MKRSRIKPISDKRKKQLEEENKIRQVLHIKQNGLCAWCGKRPDWRGLSIHHKLFKSRCGLSNIENLELLCGKCHARKHGIKEVNDE